MQGCEQVQVGWQDRRPEHRGCFVAPLLATRRRGSKRSVSCGAETAASVWLAMGGCAEGHVAGIDAPSNAGSGLDDESAILIDVDCDASQRLAGAGCADFAAKGDET